MDCTASTIDTGIPVSAKEQKSYSQVLDQQFEYTINYRLRFVWLLLVSILTIFITGSLELIYNVNCLGIGATIVCGLMLGSYRKSIIEPSSTFYFTFWIFLVSRHFLSDIGVNKFNIISSGPYSSEGLTEYRLVLIATVFLIGFFSYVGSGCSLKCYKMTIAKSEQILKYIFKIRKFALFVFLLSGPILSYSVFNMAKLIFDVGYMEALDDDSISHFSQRAYSALKWSWILLFIPNKAPKSRVLVTCVFLLFLAFTLASGMRGFFFLYVLLAFILFAGLDIIKVRPLVAILLGCIGLEVTTLLLEYRLGFAVGGDTSIEKIFSAIWSQGVTTEVFYGAVEQADRLSFVSNVLLQGKFGNVAFGYVLDELRGMSFVGKSGLGSSGFAEAFAGGWLVYISVLFLFSVVVQFLNFCFYNLKQNQLGILYLFFFLPAVLYFPRGSCVPLFTKTLLIVFIIIMLGTLKLKRLFMQPNSG